MSDTEQTNEVTDQMVEEEPNSEPREVVEEVCVAENVEEVDM